jgi:hypothetical protein
VWRYKSGNLNPYIKDEQTTQWQKEIVQKDKQRTTKHIYKTKDRVTRSPLKTGCELRCSVRMSSSCSTSDTCRVYYHIFLFVTSQSNLLYRKSSLRKFYGRHLVDRYGIYVLQMTTKHIYKTKDRVTRSPLKTGGELRCSGRMSSSCSTSDTCRVNLVTCLDRYGIYVLQMTTYMFHLSKHFPVLSSFMTYHRACN